jgi:hypothetical protein
VNPTPGTTFDTLDEAYDFYNLYAWETGFGIRYGKSRLNAGKKKCMQEIVCMRGVSAMYICVSISCQGMNDEMM